MIFSGDIVFPNMYSGDLLKRCDSDFWSRPKTVNLESSVVLSDVEKLTKGVALRSSQDVLSFFEALNVKCVSLANNHIFDFDIDIDQQIHYLADAGVSVIGAGRNLQQAIATYHHIESNVVTISFGWNVIRCQYATEASAGVNPYEYSWVEKQLKAIRMLYPDVKLVAVFHWNYEFELYPQPADREFAHHLIDLGVDAVIGHHAHIIQGFEMYNEKPIFYGLGNCYFPNGEYGGFQLNFKDAANRGLSVSLLGDQVKAYVTELIDNQYLAVVEEGDPFSIDALIDVSGFQGMSHREYIAFFASHRVKKKALPIYRSYKNTFANYCFDKFVIGRQIPVDLISKLRGGSR